MKLSYPLTAIAAALFVTGMNAAARDNSINLREAFFPGGNVSEQMEEAIAAIPFAPQQPGMARSAAQAAPYEGGMHGDWRPAEVVGYTDKGVNLYKYIYYYDKAGTFYSKGQSMVRLYQYWNGSDEIWENKMRLKLIFDDRGDIVESYTDQGFTDQWNNWYHIDYTYDDNHNVLTSNQQSWYEDGWFSTLKWENVYDEAGNLLTQTYYNRPLGSAGWNKGSQMSWRYDADGRITFHEISHWSEASQKYSPYLTEEFEFDAAGNLLTETRHQNGDPTFLYTYTYDENNNRTTFLHRKWNGEEWADYMFIDYTYDDTNRETENISKLWDGSDWKLHQKRTSQYFPLAQSQTFSNYDAENQKWKENSRLVTRYDEEGHVVCIANDEWSDVFGFLKTQKQELFSYTDGLLVSYKSQDWNSVDMKFDDLSDYAFTYNDDRNCTNCTAAKKQSKEWVYAPYNNMADQWACEDYDPYAADVTYMNVNDYVEPTGITLDMTEVTLEPEFTQQLKATVAPANASNPEYYWKSSDDKVARVSVNGKVYALDNGEATITAYTMDGKHSAQCKVTVKEYNGISSTTAEGRFAYTEGSILFTPASERHSLAVYDIAGKCICADSRATEISTAAWAPGLYLVKTVDGNVVRTYKIIVK